ncbi:MAG: hypothetical protein ACUVSQ_08945 [Pseudanabaenaceae cyanobacterium]
MPKFSLPPLRHLQTKLQDTLAEWDAQALAATERAIANLEEKIPSQLPTDWPQKLTQGFQNLTRRTPKP